MVSIKIILTSELPVAQKRRNPSPIISIPILSQSCNRIWQFSSQKNLFFPKLGFFDKNKNQKILSYDAILFSVKTLFPSIFLFLTFQSEFEERKRSRLNQVSH